VIWPAEKYSIRRYQVLHVYHFTRKQTRISLRRRATRLWLSRPLQTVWLALLICLTVFLCLLGIYGTAAMVICTAVSQLVAHSIRIRRPFRYLKNREKHDACMLVAPHANATEWHLYIGDRGVVDTLLNKPMLAIPEGKSAHFAARWFLFAHLLQLAVMTFVAAQKAWDGVSLAALLALHWVFNWSLHSQTLARDWLEGEGVDATAKTFEFGGRFAMIGAIQIFSRTDVTHWMDDILVPHPRRDGWLKSLKGDSPTGDFEAHDTKWIENMTEASLASAKILKQEFNEISNLV
jgi:hypothetical protein